MEVALSLPEKLYLTMVLIMFASFTVLLAMLSWLDARETRLQRRREQIAKASTKAHGISPSGAATQQ
jgi:hypothetical protein